jgi:serine/threonine protein kinase
VDMDGRVVIADFGLARPLAQKVKGSWGRGRGGGGSGSGVGTESSDTSSDVLSAHIAAPEVSERVGDRARVWA